MFSVILKQSKNQRKNQHIKTNVLCKLIINRDDVNIGGIYFFSHPQDKFGVELHLYIKPEWQKRWLTKELRDEILFKLIETAKLFKINIIYSTALNAISPRLLEFFGFIEYNRKYIKKYYYLKVI
jgi:RimJ/RimL family protein N-acetyltransferase